MTKKELFFLGWALGLALAAPAVLWAQSPAAETLQQNAPSRPDTEVPTTTTISDADLGEIAPIQKIPKPATLTFTTSQQFFYTDNVFYTHTSPVGSTAYLGSYTGSYVPYSTRDWTPRISLQYNMVRYGTASSGDFDNENATFSNQYVFSDDRAWSWTSTVNLSRYTAPHSNDHEFYQEVIYDNQISHVQQLIKNTPLFFIAAYNLTYHQADPALFDRLDNTLSFSLAYSPIPSVTIGPFVRPSARTYLTNAPVAAPTPFSTSAPAAQHDRDDFNLSEGVDVTWQPSKFVSLSADFIRTDDYSNNAALSYNDTIPGASVTATVKF